MTSSKGGMEEYTSIQHEKWFYKAIHYTTWENKVQKKTKNLTKNVTQFLQFDPINSKDQWGNMMVFGDDEN